MRILFKLAHFLKEYKKECILGPMFKLFEAILELLLPTIMALVINNGVIMKDETYVLKMGAIMVSMAVLGFCSSMVCQYFAARASQGFGTTLRNTLFQHISSLSYKDIDSFGVVSLTNRITNDVNQLQLAVAMLIRLVVRAPFIVIGAIIMSMILDIKLSLILIATTPFFAIILYFFITRTTPIYKNYQKKLDKLSLTLRENLIGVRVIRAFAKTSKEKHRFEKDNDDVTDTAIRVGRVSALLNPLTSLIMNGAIIILLWIGAFQINVGELSPGTIVAFINYITQILLALIVVANLIVIFTKATASANRINEVLDTTSSIEEISNEVYSEGSKHGGEIQFKDVCFRYNDTGDMALSHINLSITPGQTIGIIGGTGSGKSTLINMIPRFYDVTEGKIEINGIDVKKYSLKELRDNIGIVPQKPELFTGTIAENIRWGNEKASMEEVVAAARDAQAHEFIEELPKGYDTEVTRGGTNFSGGQKQRLTIARALVKNPEIIILDDASSALDFATDAALRKAIKEKKNRATLLLVSQRVSAIKNADKIVVLDDGHIVGLGNHDDLIKNCEIYREICLSQLSNKEVAK